VTSGLYDSTAGRDVPLAAQLLLEVIVQVNANSISLPQAPSTGTAGIARAPELTLLVALYGIASPVEYDVMMYGTSTRSTVTTVLYRFPVLTVSPECFK
jgi:hypothetical protein